VSRSRRLLKLALLNPERLRELRLVASDRLDEALRVLASEEHVERVALGGSRGFVRDQNQVARNEEAVMSEWGAERWAAAAGIVFVVLSVVGDVLPGGSVSVDRRRSVDDRGVLP
jgi:hypothetical protein